jgi:CheY-like chemotaxis protein
MRKLHACSILIVQEDPRAAMILAHVVQDEGGIPTVCATAKEAVLAVKQGRVAAAILDEGLPQADVCELLQRRTIPYVLHDAVAEVHGGPDDQSADALIGKLVALLNGMRGWVAP